MTPREIVYRAIEFRSPPRVPVKYKNRDLELSDVLSTGYDTPAGFKPSEPGMTEWGWAWRTLDNTIGQPQSHPLSDDLAVDTYRPPDPYAPGRLDLARADIGRWKDKFVKFSMGISGFNLAIFLRGMENLLTDLCLQPARASKVIHYIFDFESAIIDQLGPLAADCVAFGDDWGTQEGLIIAPAAWRKVFKPLYADQFARARKAGKKTWMHTCGNVREIIGDFIDIGLDVIELLQPDVMGVESLAREFGGKICFCCSIDHQRLAINGSRQEIFDYARRLNDLLGSRHGGFIAYIEDYSCLGMSERNYRWIRQAFESLAMHP